MIAIAQATGPASEAETADADFCDQLRRVHTNADRLFGCLMVVQFVACAAAAWWLTPYTWSGHSPAIHPHVWSVMTVGAAATLLPALLCWRRPGEAATRYAVAVAQMIVGALLIHISGGRIEMHFHVFGSLAFLAAYRDWRVILIASAVVAVDHVARGLYWPTSVFGIDQPALWRAMEHAGWVAFEDVILLLTTSQSIREMRKMSVANARMQGLIAQQERHASEVEQLNAELERRVEERTEELAAERELLDSMIRGLPNAVFWKDTAGVYLGCNEAFARFVGAEDSSAVIGRTDDDLAWDSDTRAKKVERETRVITTRQPLVDAEVTKTLDDGTAREVIASKTVLTDSCGDVRGVVSIYTEVTELNRLRTRLQESDKLQAVGRLAAGIAHEINTPIQTAAANLEFLRAGIEQLLDLAEVCHTDVDAAGDATQRATIEPGSFERLKLHAPGAINDSAQAIERVTEIVRAMRIMSHPGKEQKVETDVNTLARSAATITRSRWKEVAEVEFDLDAGLPQVECHAGVISQVLLNLVVNASDAIADNRESGDPLGTITLRTRSDGEGVVVEIADTGGGVPEAIRYRLFEPFFTTKDVGRGTGQGLAIAYDAVVDKHGGRLECDSAPGAGATFRVWLPRLAAPVVAGRIGGQTA